MSFDDGWVSLLWAHERLRERGLRAVLFLTTLMPELRERGRYSGFVRQRFPRMAERYGDSLVPLSWDELAQLVGEGLVLGSHTHTHTRLLPGVSPRELSLPRGLIRERLGVDAVDLAYPYGRRRDLSPRLVPLLRELGYRRAFTGHGWPITPLSNPHLLPRAYVDPSWSVPELRRVLSAPRALMEGLSWLAQAHIPRER